jgi:hypothetical protein
MVFRDIRKVRFDQPGLLSGTRVQYQSAQNVLHRQVLIASSANCPTCIVLMPRQMSFSQCMAKRLGTDAGLPCHFHRRCVLRRWPCYSAAILRPHPEALRQEIVSDTSTYSKRSGQFRRVAFSKSSALIVRMPFIRSIMERSTSHLSPEGAAFE